MKYYTIKDYEVNQNFKCISCAKYWEKIKTFHIRKFVFNMCVSIKLKLQSVNIKNYSLKIK